MLKVYTKILLFFFAVSTVNLYSKDLPKTYDAPVQLSKSDKKKIERANELIKAGMDLWDQLNQRYNPDNITSYKIDSICNKDASPILFKAAQKFMEGNYLKYEVYHENCVEFFKKHRYDSPSGLENAKKYQKEALNYIDKAQSNRRSADNYKNEYVKAYSRFFEAISLEIIAVKKEGRSLQIYQDWPVHYAYQFDDDIEVDLFNPKVAAVVKKDPPKTDPPKVEVKEVKKDEPYVEPYDSTVIYYQVQIAAHTQPLTQDYLKNIYIGAIRINEIHEDEWYKYTLGRYKTFDEAAKLLRSINVPKAFVVAYKNGKRVRLKEVAEPVQKSLNAPGQEKEKPKPNQKNKK
jgi:hypothetical protein